MEAGTDLGTHSLPGEGGSESCPLQSWPSPSLCCSSLYHVLEPWLLWVPSILRFLISLVKYVWVISEIRLSIYNRQNMWLLARNCKVQQDVYCTRLSRSNSNSQLPCYVTLPKMQHSYDVTRSRGRAGEAQASPDIHWRWAMVIPAVDHLRPFATGGDCLLGRRCPRRRAPSGFNWSAVRLFHLSKNMVAQASSSRLPEQPLRAPPQGRQGFLASTRMRILSGLILLLW